MPKVTVNLSNNLYQFYKNISESMGDNSLEDVLLTALFMWAGKEALRYMTQENHTGEQAAQELDD